MRDRYASLREGLVGAWIPSVSGSGLLLPDLSGQGNNGTLTNMDASDWVSGKYGRVLDFDGANDYVTIANTTSKHSFVQNTAVFSISLFAKFDATGSSYGLIGSTTATADKGWIIRREASNTIGVYVRLGVSGQTVFGFTSSTSLLANVSYHIAAIGNGSICRIYIDGNENGSQILQDGLASGDSTYDTAIARNQASGGIQYLDGQLDDVRIYNRALSEPEIKLLASRPGIGLRPQRRSMYYAPPTGARRRRILTSMP